MTPSTESRKGPDIGIDLSQFTEVFFEEASEHLGIMESLLLAVGDEPPTDEDLNAIFRAAHSIKGGAAMFGFQDVTELTHDLESTLDAVRKHELALSQPMIDAFLEARDLTAHQLAQHKAGQPGTPDDPATVELRARVRAFKSGGPVAAKPSAPLAPAAPAAQPSAGAAAASSLPKDDADAEAAYRRVVASLSGGPAPQPEDWPRVVAAVVAPPAAERQAASDAAAAASDGAPEPAKPAVQGKPTVVEESDDFGLFVDPKVEAAAPEALAAAQAAGPSAVPAAADKPKAAAGAKAAPPQSESSSIRVAVEKVDQLINMVGELVITQAMLQQRANELDPVAFRSFLTAMGDLERNTRSLQEAVMSIRMLPMSMVFNRFPRMVRDLAAKLGKKVDLKLVGEATEVDKGMIEKIVDPLTHLVRNSMDHGIETPDKRIAAGKPATGTVTLSAYHQGGSIIIEVTDDGGGLHRDRILGKARERGMSVSDAMTDQEVWALIFEAGFSTAAAVTDVSGRGVGMDVVRKNITSLGGSVEIESQAGKGSVFRVRLPLTLAIMDGMSVAVGSETYIIPLGSIIESLQIQAASVRTVTGAGRVVQVRSEYLPVVTLRDVFQITSSVKDESELMMVIVEADGVKTALLVDELVGQHQVVVKNLEANYKKIPGVSAATIMGDGRVGFILDVPALVRKARH